MTDGNYDVVINSSSNVMIESAGNSGYAMYTIVPILLTNHTLHSNVSAEYTITNFKLSTDTINLELFTQIRSFEDLNLTRGSVVLTLSRIQRVRILGLNPVNMTASQFVFASLDDDVPITDISKPADDSVVVLVLSTVLPVCGVALAIYIGWSLHRHYKKTHAVNPDEEFKPVVNLDTEHPELAHFDHIHINDNRVVDKHEAIDYLKKQLHMFSVLERKDPLQWEIDETITELNKELKELADKLEEKKRNMMSEIPEIFSHVAIDVFESSSSSDENEEVSPLRPWRRPVQSKPHIDRTSKISDEEMKSTDDSDDSERHMRRAVPVDPYDFESDYGEYLYSVPFEIDQKKSIEENKKSKSLDNVAASAVAPFKTGEEIKRAARLKDSTEPEYLVNIDVGISISAPDDSYLPELSSSSEQNEVGASEHLYILSSDEEDCGGEYGAYLC